MGYPVELFTSKEEIDGKFLCVICQDVLEGPVVIHPCQHMFCLACIDKWLIQSLTCPSCRNPVAKYRSPALAFLKLLEALQLKCQFSGCTAVVALGGLKGHENKCEFNNAAAASKKKTPEEEEGGGGVGVGGRTTSEPAPPPAVVEEPATALSGPSSQIFSLIRSVLRRSSRNRGGREAFDFDLLRDRRAGEITEIRRRMAQMELLENARMLAERSRNSRDESELQSQRSPPVITSGPDVGAGAGATTAPRTSRRRSSPRARRGRRDVEIPRQNRRARGHGRAWLR